MNPIILVRRYTEGLYCTSILTITQKCCPAPITNYQKEANLNSEALVLIYDD